jgi:hypothetical protein
MMVLTLSVLACVYAFMTFTVHHIHQEIQSYEDPPPYIVEMILHSMAYIIACLGITTLMIFSGILIALIICSAADLLSSVACRLLGFNGAAARL